MNIFYVVQTNKAFFSTNPMSKAAYLVRLPSHFGRALKRCEEEQRQHTSVIHDLTATSTKISLSLVNAG